MRAEIERLRRVRHVAGLRLQDVAGPAAIDSTLLSKIEHGHRPARPEQIATVRRVLIGLLPVARARIEQRLVELDVITNELMAGA